MRFAIRSLTWRSARFAIILFFFNPFSSVAYAQQNGCFQSTYIFGKFAAASVSCNLPDSQEVRKWMTQYLNEANMYCGKIQKMSDFPGAKAGSQSFFDEVGPKPNFPRFGEVCGKIYGGVLDGSLTSVLNNKGSSACQRFPNLC